MVNEAMTFVTYQPEKLHIALKQPGNEFSVEVELSCETVTPVYYYPIMLLCYFNIFM